jgi:hypothetical protein
MTLTAVLLTLKILTVFIEPDDPSSHDDQTLATCMGHAMTARPSGITLVTARDQADATIRVENRTGLRIHVLGSITLKDGTKLITVNHVTHGLNHTLCHQADGLLDELARKIKIPAQAQH